MTSSQRQEPESVMVNVFGRGLVPVEQIRSELLRWSIGEDVARQANADHRVHPTQVAVVERAVMPATKKDATSTALAGLILAVVGFFWWGDGGANHAGVVVAVVGGLLLGGGAPWLAISQVKKAVPLVRVEPVQVRLGGEAGLGVPGRFLLPAGSPDVTFAGMPVIAHVIHLPKVPPVVLSLDADSSRLILG